MKKLLIIIVYIMIMILGVSCSNQTQQDADALNIYMLNDNEMVRKALSCYQAEVPEMKINIEVGVPDYDTTVSDALKKLNTRILAGDGPDVIVMDDINYESYVKSGQLSDLSKIVKHEKNLSASIVENVEFGERVYALPFCVTMLADIKGTGFAIDFSSLEQFNKSAKVENAAMGDFDRQAALWYRSKIEPVLTSGDGITEKELKSFYQSLNELMSMAYAGDEEMRFASFQQFNMQVAPGLAMPKIYFKELSASKEYIDGLSALQMLCSMDEEGGIDCDFTKWHSKTMCIPMGKMAISSGSDKQKEAAALITYLISEKGQAQIVQSADIIPVNIKTLRSAMEKSDQREQVTGDLGSYPVEPFSKDSINRISKLIDKMSYSTASDGNLMEIIMLGAQGYLNGEDTLDHVTAQTLKKVGIYLAE